MSSDPYSLWVLSTIGTITSIFQCASGFPLLRKIIKEGSSANYPRLPMVLMIITCIQIGAYGVIVYGFPAGLQLLIVNSIGLFFWLIFATVMIIYAATPRARAKLIAVVVITILWGILLPLGLFIAPSVMSFETRRIILAVLMNVANVGGFFSPIEKLLEALRTGDVHRMPAILVYANVFNCLIWTSYGSILADVWIYIPNGLGLLISLLQVIVLSVIMLRQHKLKKLPVVPGLLEPACVSES